MNRSFLLIFTILYFNVLLVAQSQMDTLSEKATLHDCIDYALVHQPSIRQSLLNEKIVNQEIRSKLADWFPQINFNISVQHYYELPTSIYQGREVHFGSFNTSSIQFSATQNILNRDVCGYKCRRCS